MNFSKTPFKNERTGTEGDADLRREVEKALIEEHGFKSPIVRNSGTLVIALQALWRAADAAVRERVGLYLDEPTFT